MPGARILRLFASAILSAALSAASFSTAFFNAIQLSCPYSRASACCTSRNTGFAGALG